MQIIQLIEYNNMWDQSTFQSSYSNNQRQEVIMLQEFRRQLEYLVTNQQDFPILKQTLKKIQRSKYFIALKKRIGNVHSLLEIIKKKLEVIFDSYILSNKTQGINGIQETYLEGYAYEVHIISLNNQNILKENQSDSIKSIVYEFFLYFHQILNTKEKAQDTLTQFQGYNKTKREFFKATKSIINDWLNQEMQMQLSEKKQEFLPNKKSNLIKKEKNFDFIDQPRQAKNQRKQKTITKVICGHPQRPHFAHQKCQSCYAKTRSKKLATDCIHPERPEYANKVCQTCYFQNYYKSKRINKEMKQ